MRPVPDCSIAPWNPPHYRVDENGKLLGAVPGEPNNWGRWGELDQVGTLNLLTDERVVRATSLVRSGERFSLGIPIGKEIPYPGGREIPIHTLTRAAGDWVLGDPGPYDMQCTDDVIFMNLQAATQIDGLAHVGYGDLLYNGFWAGVVTASSGARRLGVHHCCSRLVGRGVLLDIAGHEGIKTHDGEIGPELLDAVVSTQRLSIEPGDILLLRTGLLGAWYEEPGNVTFRQQPGLSVRSVPWLAERDISFVGADNRAVEVIPSPADLPRNAFHIAALRDLGMPLGELFYLEELASSCAADGVYDFMFVAEPVPVVNAGGAPMNPIAIR